ncbi:MAG: alpha/beta hydrolase [Desulfosalsimonadaceae bacterium]
METNGEVRSSFTDTDNALIFYRYRPAENERAQIVIAHGLGEHSGRYSQMMERLSALGISSWAPDHRGHGRSSGRRGHIGAFADYIKDLDHMIRIARNEAAGALPCFFLGHSMGGLMVLNHGEKHPGVTDGIIASSPGLAPARPVPKTKSALGKCMSCLWPGLTLDNELDACFISHDPDVVTSYERDPLVHHRVSARWFTEFMAAADETMDNAGSITVPVLLQVAGDDHLVKPEAAQKFAKELSVEDKTLLLYEGLYHEIYNETADRREKVLTDLENWLTERI